MSSDPPASAYCFSSHSVNQAACSARGDTPLLYSRSALFHGMEGPAGFPVEESQSGISWRSTGVLWFWPPGKGPSRFDVDSCGSLVRGKRDGGGEKKEEIKATEMDKWKARKKMKRKRKDYLLSSPPPSSSPAFICPFSSVNSRDLNDKWQKTAGIFFLLSIIFDDAHGCQDAFAIPRKRAAHALAKYARIMRYCVITPRCGDPSFSRIGNAGVGASWVSRQRGRAPRGWLHLRGLI